MNLLAIDTATERCSVAIRTGGRWFERSVDTQRGHAEIVLSMVDDVLRESQVHLKALDGIAYGRGPGAFTGVRIAIGVVQGLAFGADLQTIGISNLAAIAQQVSKPDERVLACIDARMHEIYWASFQCDAASGLVDLRGDERLTRAAAINEAGVDIVCGSALAAYPELGDRYAMARRVDVLPRAREILLLGERALLEGQGKPAVDAQPVYLRDQVTFVKTG